MVAVAGAKRKLVELEEKILSSSPPPTARFDDESLVNTLNDRRAPPTMSMLSSRLPRRPRW